MRDNFIRSAIELTNTPADFISGNRKILCNRTITFDGPLLDDFAIEDCGFTKMKMSLLKNLYVVDDSIEAAVRLWEIRKDKAKYGSVGFHCYNHLMKNDPTKTSKRGSTMGPCIQAVILSWIPGRERKSDGWCDIAVYYRTTEFYKKFAADLILLRDVLLPNFDFEEVPIRKITFNFANITVHPMYFSSIIPFIDRPLSMLKSLEEDDPHFWTWIIKWTARYLCPEYGNGIEKFEQAKRVRMDALNRIDPKVQRRLAKYIRSEYKDMKGYIPIEGAE